MRLHTSTYKNFGFALVATVSMMVLLTLVAIAMLSLSTIEQRSSGGSANEADRMARANARMALMIAIGELQEAAGPDQRVTATSALLGSSGNAYTSGTTAQDGKKHWVGVWDTSSYNPAAPDSKTFKRWLVSGDEAAVDDIADVGTNPATDDLVIFEGADAAGTVKVPKVEVATTSGNSSYYAYWVEDQGVKADLEWNETLASDTSAAELERAQVRRLSASPGPDYGVLGGPFASTQVQYPIDQGGGSNDYLDDMQKALSPADMGLVMGSTADHSDWLKLHRHDMTFGSRGVMADVKKGGLRRDLSLAFEMDGAAEAATATIFNQQTAEFVGSGNTASDPLSAPSQRPDGVSAKPNGLPTFERFLWRDWNGAGNPFSNEIPLAYDPRRPSYQPTVRGPNWWVLRDYANLYKRLKLSSGQYAMQSRAYYPNRSSEGGYAYSDLHSPFGVTQSYDREFTEGSPWPSSSAPGNSSGPRYLYRPAQANYAPVNLGFSALVGIKAVNATASDAALAITLDPLFYFWNPYNRKISCDGIVVTLGRGIPGRVLLQYTDAGGNPVNEDLNLWKLLKDNVINRVGGRILYLVKGPFTLEPGEVVIAQPIAGTGSEPGTGEAELGYSLGNNTGVAMTNLKSGEIRLPLSTSVGWAFKASDYQQGSTTDEVRHEMDTSLPGNPNLSLAQIVADLRNKIGDQTQFNLQVLWSSMKGPATYISPFAVSNTTSIVRSEPVSNLLNVKEIFGANALLVRPASDGTVNANPVEMFARFNPATMLMNRDWYAHHFPSQQERVVSANSEFEVRNLLGIDFSGSLRKTFYGLSYQNTGSTTFPLLNIPTAPIYSLASFADANLSVNGTDPMRAVGNSWSNPNINPIKPYMEKRPSVNGSHGGVRLQDFSWLINDALFDRYYLSGIAPAFNYNGANGAYNSTGTLNATLTDFYGADYKSAAANPALAPHVPSGKTSTDIVSELLETELNNTTNKTPGYKKTGAYSLIKGAFNVNSTSVKAWEALLRANRDLAVRYAEGGASAAAGGSPFPSSGAPTAPGIGGAKPYWSGFSRLTDAQISSLAAGIVDQVKLRGPFMSISDFVNHRVGYGNALSDNPVDKDESYTGALQAAIDLVGSDINSGSRGAAANAAAVDADAQQGDIEPFVFSGNWGWGLWTWYQGPLNGRKSSTGIPGDLTQADLLLPLAPRLNARTDTFKIRGYGEVRNSSGDIIASAICEAVVQRLPEYVDPKTNPNDNEPWDESNLNNTNQIYGRRFEIRSFRWLDAEEV